MAKPSKNTLVLSILFFGPLLFYLFLLTGTNNFAKLPRLTENIDDIENFSSAEEVKLANNISVLCFIGSDLLNHKTNALKLNEKIYKNFYGFKGFQFLVVLQKGSDDNDEQLKK